jgi:DNA-binding Lrp family transcriptional regulator
MSHKNFSYIAGVVILLLTVSCAKDKKYPNYNDISEKLTSVNYGDLHCLKKQYEWKYIVNTESDYHTVFDTSDTAWCDTQIDSSQINLEKKSLALALFKTTGSRDSKYHLYKHKEKDKYKLVLNIYESSPNKVKPFVRFNFVLFPQIRKENLNFQKKRVRDKEDL